jgi:hypothetical protein
VNPAGHGTDHLDGRHDFDFILGGWKCATAAQPILGGLSPVDRIWSDKGSADGQWERFTLSQFDPADRVWRIWSASTRAPGRLGPPLAGRFAVRPLGTGVLTDDGNTWQTNWIMEFTRVESVL